MFFEKEIDIVINILKFFLKRIRDYNFIFNHLENISPPFQNGNLQMDGIYLVQFL